MLRWYAACLPCPACGRPPDLWRLHEQGGAGAAEVLEMLHHADSCDLGAPHMQEVTLTGARLFPLPALGSYGAGATCHADSKENIMDYDFC